METMEAKLYQIYAVKNIYRYVGFNYNKNHG